MIADPVDYRIRISYSVSFIMLIMSEPGRRIYRMFSPLVVFLDFHGLFRDFSIFASIPLYIFWNGICPNWLHYPSCINNRSR